MAGQDWSTAGGGHASARRGGESSTSHLSLEPSAQTPAHLARIGCEPHGPVVHRHVPAQCTAVAGPGRGGAGRGACHVSHAHTGASSASKAALCPARAHILHRSIGSASSLSLNRRHNACCRRMCTDVRLDTSQSCNPRRLQAAGRAGRPRHAPLVKHPVLLDVKALVPGVFLRPVYGGSAALPVRRGPWCARRSDGRRDPCCLWCRSSPSRNSFCSGREMVACANGICQAERQCGKRGGLAAW